MKNENGGIAKANETEHVRVCYRMFRC